jgi:phenylpropionate dioxygenase-like ring-hydroxylating dioxygenase large terminal subunit
MNKPESIVPEDLSDAVRIGVDAYVSEDYARAERDRLWRKVWLQAGRVEEIPEPGNFMTYDILDDSVIIVRREDGGIEALWNVCSHRGRKLIDVPAGQRYVTGRKTHFRCGFHGWRFDLGGKCIHVPERDDWKGALTDENTRLGPVKVDTWGGWVFVNLDPDAEPLRDYLEPLASLLDPFEPQNMRFRWRRWGIFDCNWKVAVEAFNETYHVEATHPEFMAYGSFRGWGKRQGKHSNIGYEAPKNMDENKAKLRLGAGADPRQATADLQRYTWENANTNTTMTLVAAAERLVDELPEGTPPAEVLQHWLKTARADDEKRGVFWPVVDPVHVGQSGTACQIFPNFQIGHAVNNLLCYSVRPYGTNPDKCIFEAAVYELFPEGEAPETEWVLTPAEQWPPVLQQDFENMAAVQQGMKSGGFRGTIPNPYMERTVASLHYNLAKYMGAGAPQPLK